MFLLIMTIFEPANCVRHFCRAVGRGDFRFARGDVGIAPYRTSADFLKGEGVYIVF